MFNAVLDFCRYNAMFNVHSFVFFVLLAGGSLLVLKVLCSRDCSLPFYKRPYARLLAGAVTVLLAYIAAVQGLYITSDVSPVAAYYYDNYPLTGSIAYCVAALTYVAGGFATWKLARFATAERNLRSFARLQGQRQRACAS